MTPKDKKTLKEALETVLSMAKAKLENAIAKNKEWDIEQYKKDVAKIEDQLKDL